MKKVVFILFCLLTSLLLNYSNFNISKSSAPNKEKGRAYRIVLTQNTETEEKKEEDSQYIALLKQIKEKVDGWLKSINERIEREDVSRLKVRFLEILRNILEWVSEKIDSKLESSKGKKT
jgi:tRNA U54 and U55 pseudouridine synthase Pus10